jgi:hypothetical protein
MNIQNTLNQLNSEMSCGDITLLDTNDETFKQIGMDGDPEPTDVVIYYDYDFDDNTEDQYWVFDHALPTIATYMESRGYEEVYDNDGSGGGLVYGAIVYRKK